MLLRCKNITKTYGGITALRGIDLTFPEGGIYALIGPNGSGKTTLLNILSGFLAPNSGVILLRGNDLAKLSPHQRSRLGIGRTFQRPRVVEDLTLVENILLSFGGRWSETLWVSNQTQQESQRARERARAVLADFLLDDDEERRGGSLSYGERKLLSLACVVARSPQVVLLDEPVEGVSLKVRETIVQSILRMNEEGRLVIMCEHNMEVVRAVAEAVIVLEDGKIVARGGRGVLETDIVQRVYYGD